MLYHWLYPLHTKFSVLFVFKYIECSACEYFTFERINEGIRLNDSAARGVDEIRAFLYCTDIFFINEMVCVRVVGDMERNDIRLCK